MTKGDYERQYYDALRIAQRAHERQLDKGMHPYIMHPVRVSEMCHTRSAKIAALLHDTIEDSVLEAKDLVRQGISKDIAAVVTVLTHKKGESYTEYIHRVADDQIATEVKIADLKDNMDITRLLGQLDEKDFQRLQKYKAAYDYLMELSED